MHAAIGILDPPKKIIVSEWAQANVYLERGTTPDPGEWDNTRAPYQVGMMDAVCDPAVEDVVMMTSAQIGKTTILLNVIGYFIDQDPSPMLVVLPTVELGEAWSKDRLAPMVRSCPSLKAKVRSAKSRDSENTILQKRFMGGSLAVVGANAPSGLAMRPVRILICDEVDRFPASAGSEGDPIALARKRTENYYNRKNVDVSTPTVKGLSRIEEEFKQSTQNRYHVPCPRCGEFQVLKWNPADGKGGVIWKALEDGTPDLESVRYQCGVNKCEVEEWEKQEMLERGEWRAAYPGRRKVGFHINALYSPWRRWAEIVEEWDGAKKNPERLKVFVNTVLGETWEESGEKVEADTLKARRYKFAAEVPRGVGAIVVSIDVQTDRFEIVAKGYGKGEESWLVDHATLAGDPGQGKMWDRLDTYLRAVTWVHESGRRVGPDIVVIDSGFQTDMVYRFTGAREEGWRCSCIALKGMSGVREIVGKPSRSERYRVKFYVVGVDTAKDIVFARFRQRAMGPGYIHLPDWAEDEYIEQLASEVSRRRWAKGRGWIREYHKTRERNEGLDLEVYALAGFRLLGSAFTTIVEARAAEWAKKVEPGEVVEVKEPKERRRRGGGWVTRWKG
jgi:phage terminase large subunit GpA-like protein